MKRRLLNVLTALSLLFCVAVVTLWVRSYWRYEAVYFTRVGGTAQRPDVLYFFARSSLGSVSLSWVHENASSALINPSYVTLLGQGWVTQTESSAQVDPLPFPGRAGWLGFRWHFESFSVPKQTRRDREVLLPYWFPALLFGLSPAAWLFARLRRRAAARGFPVNAAEAAE